MGHKRQAFYQRLNLRPNFGEHRGVISIFMTGPMYLTAPEVIIVRLGLDEGVERIYYLTITHNDYSNGTNRRTLIVSRFKIYCCKILHIINSTFYSIASRALLSWSGQLVDL